MLFEIGWPREEAVWMIGHFIAPVTVIDSMEAAKRSDGERSGTWIGPFRQGPYDSHHRDHTVIFPADL